MAIYGNQQQAQYTPQTFNRSWLMPGGQYYATPYQRESWRRQAGNSGTAWQGNQYGYFQGTSTNKRFVPFSAQPQRSPLFVTNPAAYSRSQYMNEMQEAMDKAKAETEARYQEAMKNLEGVGEQERADIQTRFDSTKSAVGQNLATSGLANTTVAPTMQRGVERERTSALNRLSAMLARERNQLLQSRSDIPPNLQLYASLMQGAGRGGM